MYSGRTVFSQILDLMPNREFRRCVDRYRGNYKVQKFTCQEQFRCMAFAQLTYRHSLRDIEVCLRAMSSRLYHVGIRSRISKSTLADANENRDSRIYSDFAHHLMAVTKILYAEDDLDIDLDASLYALDSSIINLCLTSSPWSQLNQTRGGIKLHTLLNLRGNIPAFMRITNGGVGDVHGLDSIIIEPGAFYVLDRGYYDFSRLFQLHKTPAFFVTRAKKTLRYLVLTPRPTESKSDILSDQIITFYHLQTQDKYPDPFRMIKYLDPKSKRVYTFLTNNENLPATTIADIYKRRWQIELFFKWIKQHLRIKTIFGTSRNAVKTQIWIAVSTYLLVAILKKTLKLDHSLYKILQVLSVSLFEKNSILQLLTEIDKLDENCLNPNQLKLFD